MITRPLYPLGRPSAHMGHPGGKRSSRPDYDLIAQLRRIRAEGDEAMTAAEQYDPDFAIKLSSCTDEAEANQLLHQWLIRRMDVLKLTQARLRHVWQTTRQKVSQDGRQP
jgi:hypothetical protein